MIGLPDVKIGSGVDRAWIGRNRAHSDRHARSLSDPDRAIMSFWDQNGSECDRNAIGTRSERDRNALRERSARPFLISEVRWGNAERSERNAVQIESCFATKLSICVHFAK